MKFLFFLIILFFAPGLSFSDQSYGFTCKDSKIEGSIKYGFIGTYHFTFKDCLGTLVYDPLSKQVRSVQLKIKIKSLNSNCAWCDKIVLSKRLLDCAQYPEIVYESQTFTKKDQEYKVVGNVHVHGVNKSLKSEFSLEAYQQKTLLLKGSWLLRRKDYNLIWNKLFDHGGFVVGETVQLNWRIYAK